MNPFLHTEFNHNSAEEQARPCVSLAARTTGADYKSLTKRSSPPATSTALSDSKFEKQNDSPARLLRLAERIIRVRMYLLRPLYVEKVEPSHFSSSYEYE